MDPARKVTVLEGTLTPKTSNSSSDTVEDPQPGTSSGVFKIPTNKAPKAAKKKKVEKFDDDAVVKRMCVERKISKVTPDDLDFPEGIIFKPPGSDSETKSILCTTPSNDDDVLVIDLSEEEIADILGSNKVEKKSPKQKRHRIIRKYLEITPSSGSDDKIEKTSKSLFTEKEAHHVGEVKNLEEEISKMSEKTSGDEKDPMSFDIIDLTNDDDLEEKLKNVHAQVVDKYVEDLTKERFAPDFHEYVSNLLRTSPKSTDSQDSLKSSESQDFSESSESQDFSKSSENEDFPKSSDIGDFSKSFVAQNSSEPSGSRDFLPSDFQEIIPQPSDPQDKQEDDKQENDAK